MKECDRQICSKLASWYGRNRKYGNGLHRDAGQYGPAGGGAGGASGSGRGPTPQLQQQLQPQQPPQQQPLPPQQQAGGRRPPGAPPLQQQPQPQQQQWGGAMPGAASGRTPPPQQQGVPSGNGAQQQQQQQQQPMGGIPGLPPQQQPQQRPAPRQPQPQQACVRESSASKYSMSHEDIVGVGLSGNIAIRPGRARLLVWAVSNAIGEVQDVDSKCNELWVVSMRLRGMRPPRAKY
eukprot:757438-Pelagomonas_calceolata.AAC.2